jgi:hypothetical protein
MERSESRPRLRLEDLRSELAEAACRVAARHECKGAYIDLELDLWDARRAALNRTPAWRREDEALIPG